MLRSVGIANFKAIGSPRLDLELAPLTLLVGPNGSGKSSVLEAIAVFAQSVRPGRLLGLQARGRLTRHDEPVETLYFGGRGEGMLEIELSWQSGDDEEPLRCWLAVEGERENKTGRWRQGLASGTASVEFSPASNDRPHEDIRAKMQGPHAGEASVMGGVDVLLDDGLFTLMKGTSGRAELEIWKQRANRLAEFLGSDDLRYLSALRGGGLMQRTPEGQHVVAGFYGENTIRLLSHLQGRGAHDRKAWLKKAAPRFGLDNLEVGLTGGALEATFDDRLTMARVSLDSAGFGSQQALPILTDLAAIPRRGALLVEEVEHSSHPAWVAAWGETLAEAVATHGVQVIATTHAPMLVLAVARAVKAGVLSPEQVRVHELTRGPDGVQTKHWRLDEHGRFEDGWIESFASSERELLGALLSDDAPKEDPPKRQTAAASARRPRNLGRQHPRRGSRS